MQDCSYLISIYKNLGLPLKFKSLLKIEDHAKYEKKKLSENFMAPQNWGTAGGGSWYFSNQIEVIRYCNKNFVPNTNAYKYLKT